MTAGPPSSLRRGVLVVAALALVALALAPVLGSMARPLSGLRPGADGTAAFAGATVGRAPFEAGRPDPGGYVLSPTTPDVLEDVRGLAVVAPQDPPTGTEAEALAAFVDDGGRVLVADDRAQGNAFLEALGAGTRIAADPVRGLSYEKTQAFPVSTDLDRDHPVTDEASRVVLNHPSRLEIAEEATVLARLGGHAWIDADGDGAPGPDEERGPFPWLAVEPVGGGEVLVLSDPSVLADGMAAVADDGALSAGTATHVRAGGPGAVDEAHRSALDPVGAAAGSDLVALAVAVPLLGVAVVSVETSALQRVWRRVREAAAARLDPDSTPGGGAGLVDRVLHRHPEWDRSALDELAEEMEDREP